MSMEDSFEAFFERNNNSWKQVFGTYPQFAKAERFKTCGLYISEADKNNKAEWLPQKQKGSIDFADIETKIGFKINAQIKEYLTTFWFLPINSSTDIIEQFQLNPVLPNIDFKSDVISRFNKEVNHYLDVSEYFLIADFCCINGDDTYTLQVNNTTGNVVAVQVFDKRNIVVANSLIELLDNMKGEWDQ